MATGRPATVVSGVGAANRVLRDLRKPEYDARHFPRSFVKFAEIPFRRPTISADEAITPENAPLAAAQCQGCQHPACVADCPAQIDIPGVLRRMEAGNFTGTERMELHQRNPFGGLCGVVCPADSFCQRHCYRRSYAGEPVRIAELLRWVVGAAGSAGWPTHEPSRDDRRSGRTVAVLGGNLAGLTCATYLALAGCPVEVLDGHVRALSGLEAVEGELESVWGRGAFVSKAATSLPPVDGKQYSAVYLASEEWAEQMDRSTPEQPQRSKLFTAVANVESLPPAGAVAEGRSQRPVRDLYLFVRADLTVSGILLRISQAAP